MATIKIGYSLINGERYLPHTVADAILDFTDRVNALITASGGTGFSFTEEMYNSIIEDIAKNTDNLSELESYLNITRYTTEDETAGTIPEGKSVGDIKSSDIDKFLTIDEAASTYATKVELADKADTSVTDGLSTDIANQGTEITALTTRVEANESELTNISSNITTLDDDIETINNSLDTLDAKIEALTGGGVTFKAVDTLPDISAAVANVIYLVPNTSGTRDEYLALDGVWELLGSTSVDLSDYLTSDDFTKAIEYAAFLNKAQTFTELQTFEGGIKVTGENGICIEADGAPDLCTNIHGYTNGSGETETYSTEVTMMGDWNFASNGHKVTIDGTEVGLLTEIPMASDTTLGGVKIATDSNITIDGDGFINVDLDEAGTTVNVDGTKVDNLDFDTDPQTQLNSLSTDVLNQGTKIDENATDIDNLETAMTNIESNITTLDDDVSDLEDKHTALSTTVETNTTNIATNTTNIATNTTEIANLHTADAGLQAQIDAIQTASTIKEIVKTKADLEALSTTGYTAGDLVKVIADESQGGASTFYEFTSEGTWTLFTVLSNEGTIVKVGGVNQTEVSFDSDPQEQITTNTNSITTINASITDINSTIGDIGTILDDINGEVI